MPINVLDIIKIQNLTNFKLHLGTKSDKGIQPLDLFIEDENNWKELTECKNSKNEWNRNFIFSMMDFYPKTDTWLFGGVFEVLKSFPKGYEVREVQEYKEFTGRLLVNYDRHMRGRAFILENHINDMTVNQIFEYKYSGEVFPGYENINHDFTTLEPIFKTEKSDWKTALKNVKGIYLITNKANGKMYVGSAYGDFGIWGRWSEYIKTLHGKDKQFISIIDEQGPEYVKTNFKFTILETVKMNSTNDYIISRENYWKEKLMTRVHGYNSN